MTEYVRWRLESIADALQYRRILVLSGARQSGKTTLAKAISTPHVIYRTLDDIQMLQSSQADPDGFVAHGDELMIIDEVQRNPILLQAVKKNVDENPKYGRFLLTGSANIRSLPSVTESLAGRVTNMRLRPLGMGEIHAKQPTFIQNALQSDFTIDPKFAKYTKNEYIKLALMGGYPEVTTLLEKHITKWYRDYMDALIDHDLHDITHIRRKDSMRKLVQVLCAWSSKEINIQQIGASLGIERPMVESYINALETLYLVDRVPSWTHTDYEYVRKKDKLFMSDTGLMSSVLRWSFEDLHLNGEKNGKLIETFVYNQLMCILEVQSEPYNIYHYRDVAKREIDFLIESPNGDIVGIEVKAGSAVKKEHFKHLTWFKQTTAKDKNFIGIVLYTGNQVLPFGDNMWAVPICSMWS